MERPDPGTAELTEPDPDAVAAPPVGPPPAEAPDPVDELPAAAADAAPGAADPPLTPEHEVVAAPVASSAVGVDLRPDAHTQHARPDEAAPAALSDAAGADHDAPQPVVPAAARRGTLLPALLGLVLLVLLGGIGWTLLDARAAERRDDARQAALQAARQQAVNLTTISHETADRDLGRIIAAATGTLKTQFEGQRKTFPAVLRREKSVSTGRVLAAGVRQHDGDTVDALVAVDATVSNTASGSVGVVKHYRMDMRLVRVSGRWLVSAVAFAGLPQ